MLANESSGNDSINIVRYDLPKDFNTPIISHPCLIDMSEKIRAEPIPWQDYQRAGLVTEDDLDMIRYVENKSADEITSIMAEHGVYYAAMYMELMQKLARVDAVQQILVLIHDMLYDHEERIALFHEASVGCPEFPFGPFHKALRINDEYIGIQASKMLTQLICSTTNRDVDIEDYFRWITFQLQSRQTHVVELNVQILNCLFQIPSYRRIFWNTSHAMDSLVTILKKGHSNPQKVYEVIFAIWLLTFDRVVAANLNKKYDIIPTLVEIAKPAIKDKVIRVVVATFRNLVEKAPKENISAMLSAKLLPFVEHLNTRKWSDQEITDDIALLQNELQETSQNLTTFEVYASEINAGKLEWSPPHQSESFWRQNASRLNDEDHQLLRQLAQLLSSENPKVLSIACHDLGQYVKFSPKDGRRYLERVGAKQRVMELMTHKNHDVRYQALSATQKYFAMAS